MKAIAWLLFFWILAVHAETAPDLRFEISGKEIKKLTLPVLKEQLESHDLSMKDPEYGKTKHYRAFALHDLLLLGYGELWRTQDYSEIAFRAIDGYEAVADLAKMQETGGYLVYQDLDVPGWEPVGREQAIPAPFYLVWTGARQTTQYAYPWPWQLASLNLIHFADQYPAVYPQGAAKDSPAYRGFLTFKARCVRCHAMQQQGGKIGPDLDAPQNILDYRDAASVKAYIRQPSKFRYTKMPDHTDLSDRDLDDLIAYFRFQQLEKHTR
ncbi:MAG: c-type cytochrome [Gammaproteobacteria bacterium]